MSIQTTGAEVYLEVKWKNNADAEQGGNTDEDEQIFLEPEANISDGQIWNIGPVAKVS